MSTHIARLRPEEALLLVVDVQERLLPAMFEAERLSNRCVLLARTAQRLNIPVVATEQYPEKLGATVAPLAALLDERAPIGKMLFSACTDEVRSQLSTHRAAGRTSVVLCGLETHVCVMQTALDLLESGFHVFVPQDAVSSRYESDKKVGLERMKSSGAIACSTEMAVFELLRQAGTPDFKALLPFIK
jgi:nicotinamidase-related amidase